MITKHHFGTLDNGQEVSCYTMKNRTGMTVTVCEFGGAITEIRVPDKYGRSSDVVEGYDSLRDYVLADGYLGALVGRVGNRIAKGTFRLDGKTYTLFCNNGKNSLHGGKTGFSHRMWNVRPVDGEEPKLILSLHSPDGEEGYPGTLTVSVKFSWLGDGLMLHYTARCDQDTILNLTNHSYFNLNGHKSGKVYSQILQINASHYTPVKSAKAIPTGEIAPGQATRGDVRQAKPIGQDIEADDVQLGYGHGYDHNFAIDKTVEGIEKVADVYSPESGICMEVLTDNIGIQLYTANFIGGQVGKDGYKYEDRGAFCLETQFYPNSINEPNFTTPITKAGEEYNSKTVYRFAVR